MNLPLAQLATLVSVLVSFSALVFSLYSYWRQMKVQVLMKYTERYEAIMSAFPPDALSYRIDLNTLPPQSTELTLSVLKYLNLCSEEFYLRKRGYIPKDIWHIWEGDISRMLCDDLIRREWPILRAQFSAHPAFVEYVQGVQRPRDLN